MSAEYQKALGRKIAFNRKRRGLSQKEFAGLLGRESVFNGQQRHGMPAVPLRSRRRYGRGARRRMRYSYAWLFGDGLM